MTGINPTLRAARPRLLHVICTAGCLLFCAPPASADLDESVSPGSNFALGNWSLTIPADSSGGVDGDALTLPASQLTGASGYRSSWFYTEADGSMTFWTPVNGATKGGSGHPRCELREQLVPGSDGTNWDHHGISILDAQLKVMSVPSDNIAIVGQVHGHGSPPLVLVYYRYNPSKKTGSLIAKFQPKPVQAPPYQVHTLASDIKLGQTFLYQIRVADGVAAVSYNNGTPVTMTIGPEWEGEKYYFKAGSYLHMAGSAANEGAEVRFHRLAASHPNEGLKITNKAVLDEARAGSSYRATLKAGGGAGGYVWSLASGQPPAGLKLASNGVLSGTPATSAVSTRPHDFTASVRDANGNTLAKKFSIVVDG